MHTQCTTPDTAGQEGSPILPPAPPVFHLLEVELTNQRRRPLDCTVDVDGERHYVYVSAAELRSYSRFQGRVLEEVGVLIRCEAAEQGGRVGKDAWQSLVERALRAGRGRG